MTTETKTLIGVLGGTIIIIVIGALLAGRGGGNTTPTGEAVPVDGGRLVRDDSPFQGPADASATGVVTGPGQMPIAESSVERT